MSFVSYFFLTTTKVYLAKCSIWKCTWPESISNTTWGRYMAFSAEQSFFRSFLRLLIWWCSFHVWLPSWCYSTVHSTHSSTTRVIKQSKALNSFCPCWLSLTSMITSCPQGQQVTWFPFSLPWQFYFITYSIIQL